MSSTTCLVVSYSYDCCHSFLRYHLAPYVPHSVAFAFQHRMSARWRQPSPAAFGSGSRNSRGGGSREVKEGAVATDIGANNSNNDNSSMSSGDSKRSANTSWLPTPITRLLSLSPSVKRHMTMAVFLMACVLLMYSQHTVPEGHVGVYYRLGALLDEYTTPGLHFLFPVTTHVYMIEIMMHTDQVRNVSCDTINGITLTFDSVQVFSRLNASGVIPTVRAFGRATLDCHHMLIIVCQ